MVKKVRMIQVNNYRWNLVGPKDNIMVEGLALHSKQDALDWVKAYISTWTDYQYEVIPMKEDKSGI